MLKKKGDTSRVNADGPDFAKQIHLLQLSIYFN